MKLDATEYGSVSRFATKTNINSLKAEFPLIDPEKIFPKTSFQNDENLVSFISFLKNSTYQIYKEHIKNSLLINNTYERLASRNFISPLEETNIGLIEISSDLMQSYAEHARWATKFIRSLPGYNRFSNQDLAIIIGNSILNLFVIQISVFITPNNSYLILKNGIQYSRSRMTLLLGNLITSFLFKFHESFNKLKLGEYELAMFYAFVISSANGNLLLLFHF